MNIWSRKKDQDRTCAKACIFHFKLFYQKNEIIQLQKQSIFHVISLIFFDTRKRIIS